ncbi:hypothetical protein BAE44_0004180 [Dichanthelium oligosanthes]|uniref:F-box domain-containing protein n=1 Tax=Dichanthelium oligosanthes TaxID=888268 RepID=A0A1E5WBQ7_9POAL|nr:hypothetical protein BAE44_0004180 [Dichanthelium oligosanthes]
MMDVDLWASPPTDLLIEIFHRLNASDVIRCAGTCKPWRCVIIDHAWCLHPRPDRFVPDLLLLGFFHEYWHRGENKGVRRQPAPGPFESILAVTAAAADDDKPCPFMPAGSAGGVDLSSYVTVLSSRDGFLLLDGLGDARWDGRLSLVMPAGLHTVSVWVLIDDDQWTLQRAIHVPNLNWVNDAFCPRSGCLFVEVYEHEHQLVVDVETGSSRPIRSLYPKDPDDYEMRHPYEMDWSTYLSRMKHF